AKIAATADVPDNETQALGVTEGMVIGTAGYMSPEQARGQTVDRRTDIWAFGCVLYEMLTGQRLFEGKNTTDTLSLVFTKDPDWSVLPPKVPPAIRALLKRYLERDRQRRLGDSALFQSPSSPTLSAFVCSVNFAPGAIDAFVGSWATSAAR